MMMKRKTGNAGFTLIEIIITMILVGIMTAAFGHALVMSVDGMMFALRAQENSQKAQIALARTVRELQDATNIITATATQIIYARTTETYTLNATGADLTLSRTSAPEISPQTLINGVETVAIQYQDVNDTPTEWNWVVGHGIAALRAIRITLTLQGSPPQQFVTTVHPRQTTLPSASPLP
ncbi:MAG: prepilin-type N-terminal cleavage/methylation domain-containing protein [Syntrophaceae bacterium]|jgi:prepilin-type N-terminal cleavage/methylation domain-containing protein|nr:prepilin-type N-terminal cleavage/methylation domain-containing protein [Syntrophaceae bacterium]HOC58535.1 type II secretion system protein [Smithellaceae bacterium]HQM44849.1 type II secretion system protein [Smithellaceae bacterium]